MFNVKLKSACCLSLSLFFFVNMMLSVCLPKTHILMKMHLLSADVKKELDDLSKTMKNFEARVELAKDLETISAVCCITNKLSHISCCANGANTLT